MASEAPRDEFLNGIMEREPTSIERESEATFRLPVTVEPGSNLMERSLIEIIRQMGVDGIGVVDMVVDAQIANTVKRFHFRITDIGDGPTPICVHQPWMLQLPLQMQSVIALAMRGHDGKPKEILSKLILRAYRGTVLLAAKYGRPLHWGEKADDFMSMEILAEEKHWAQLVYNYKESHDELSNHFFAHLMHGAQIIGYKHPDPRFRHRWTMFYLACVSAMHLEPESEETMDLRLSDWGHQHWDNPR